MRKRRRGDGENVPVDESLEQKRGGQYGHVTPAPSPTVLQLAISAPGPPPHMGEIDWAHHEDGMETKRGS